MATFRQSSFIGGMLSPSLEGRTDYDKRLAGARRIENFIVSRFGTLRRRAGMQFMTNAYGSDSLFGAGGVTTPSGEGTKRVGQVIPAVYTLGRASAAWRNIAFVSGNNMRVTVRASGLSATQNEFVWNATVDSVFQAMAARGRDGYVEHTFSGDGTPPKTMTVRFHFVRSTEANRLARGASELTNGVPIGLLFLSAYGSAGQDPVTFPVRHPGPGRGRRSARSGGTYH